MNIGLIVLTYNDALNTLSCVESIFNAQWPTGVNLSICVVDNGSTAELSDCLLNQLPETVQLVTLPSNLGYSGGMNAGIQSLFKRQPLDYVWLLNNDCMLDKNAICKLVEGIQEYPTANILAPTLSDKQGNTVVAGGCRYFPKLGIARNNHDYHQPRDYLHGAAMVLSTPFLEKIGALDTSYFLYYEELELARQCSPQKQIYLPEVVVVHEGSGTAHRDDSLKRFTTYHAVRSALIYTHRYHRKWLWSVIFVRVIVHSALGIVSRQRRITTISVWRALRDFWRAR